MNGTRLLLDSSFLIEYLTGSATAVEFMDRATANENLLAASQITRIEVLSWPSLDEDIEAQIKGFLQNIEIHPITEAVERHTIALRRNKKLKLPDAIIAATALSFNSVLVTSDAKLLKAEIDGLTALKPIATEGEPPA